MYAVKPGWLFRKAYPSAFWKISTSVKKIFLTFDDGPHSEITPLVLEALTKFNAKATFFCIGENIEKNPEIFLRVVSEGHSIGNHTYSHLNGWKTKTKEYIENIYKWNSVVQLLVSDSSPKTTLFRPPYGKMKPSHFSLLTSHFLVIMWDVLSGDFDNGISPEKCLKNVISKTREGSIVVFHDNVKAKKNLEYVLPKTLEYFLERGYTFEALTPSFLPQPR